MADTSIPSQPPSFKRVRRNTVWLQLGALAFSAVVFGFWEFWVFREQVERIGGSTMVFRWRWGWAYEAVSDSNADGRADEIIRMAPFSKDFTCHYSMKEGWQDSDYDGKFDIHLRYDWPNGGYASQIEIDDDGDSVFDRTLIAKAVEDYFRAARGQAAEPPVKAELRP